MAGTSHDGSLWGGRFSSEPSDALKRLSSSIHFDWRLAPYDIQASLAHARGLEAAGLLSTEHRDTLLRALEAMGQEIQSGSLMPLESDEDVHGALERVLIERVGPEIGGMLRAGRSRNDQIATFVRMYMRDSAASVRALLLELAGEFLAQAERAGDAAMPARTHFQHAQPTLVAHYLLAHAWPLVRSVSRLDDWARRNQESPYGSGAAVGAGLGVDSATIATALGFDAVSKNSLDATASRDLVTEFLFVLAQAGIDLSRFAEEVVIFSSAEFSYLTVDDAYATGSSMMPQKKNPDIAELSRGKAGRLVGNLVALLTALKGLPLAYNRDLQEDKEPLFDSVDTVMLVLPALIGMVKTMTFHLETLSAQATAGFSLATDVADALVRAGVPFKEAHDIVGQLVAHCEKQGVGLHDVSEKDLQAISPHLTESLRGAMTLEASLASKTGPAGTATASVSAQKRALRAALEALSSV